jgi:signal transduction histidine kinase
MTRTLFFILACVHLFLSVIAIPQVASGAPSLAYELSTEPNTSPMRGHVDYVLDPDRNWTLDQLSMGGQPDRFRPVETLTADFGYTKANIWLRFEVQTTGDVGRAWQIHFRENFLQVLDVYQVMPDGAVRHLESHNGQTAFGKRTIAYPEMVVAFEMDPNSSSQFFVKYRSGGSSQLSFALRSKSEFEALASRKTAKNFIYYGMLLLLIMASAMAFLATRRLIFAAYFVYGSFGLLFIMHGDGNAFQYFWPKLPQFNGFASVVLGSGLVASGATFARLFLTTRQYHPLLDKVLWGLVALAAALLVSTAFVDTQIVKKTLVFIALISTLTFLISGLVAARTRLKEVRFYVVAWSGAVISSAIMASRHWLGIEISEELQFDSMRIVFVLDAALMGAAILDRINQLRQAQKDGLQSGLGEAQRNLALSGRLRELEDKYTLATELAEKKQQRLTDTVHDLRQPLHALRLNIQRLIDGKGPGDIKPEQIEETFGYLEGLVSNELSPAALRLAPIKNDEVPDTVEVLRNVHEMFAVDAKAKGLDLRVVSSGLAVHLPPLDLMRIVMNLVSNAIKYTQTGSVLVGIRRRDGVFWLEVHDTGSGMSSGAFAQLLVRTVRGDAPAEIEGNGLGLSIVQNLVSKHALKIKAGIRPSGGTCVRVSLPANKHTLKMG